MQWMPKMAFAENRLKRRLESLTGTTPADEGVI
jgi:hypothetical protein